MTAQFVPVAGNFGVKIYAPNDSRLTFCDSPFPSHKESSALDIYPANAKFNDAVACPVNGTVIAIKKYSSPNLFPKRPPLDEYLTLIQSEENSVFVKIIHAKPVVKVGDKVKVGDGLAVLIHSGYYPFWVDPHIHVELRNPTDAIRACGSYPLDVLNSPAPQKITAESAKKTGITGTVTQVEKRYVLVRPDPDFWISIGNFSGLPVQIGSSIGILDGGIPFMGYGGVVINTNVPKDTPVLLCGQRIGAVTENLVGLVKFKADSLKWLINGFEYLGVSTKITLGSLCQIKLIPFKMGQTNLKINDSIKIQKN